jgi:hypothetical protein
MAEILYAILLILLIAFSALKVSNGTWHGTWCASGRPPRGPQFPGGPHADR